MNGPGAMNCDNSQNPPHSSIVRKMCTCCSARDGAQEQASDGFLHLHADRTKNRQMEDYGAVDSVFWGRGKEESVEFWQGIVRQTVVLDYLAKEVEKYGVLHLTEKGQSFISEPHPVMLANQRDFSDVDSGDSLAQTRGDSGGALDPKLRGMLTDLRKTVSESKGLPPTSSSRTSVWMRWPPTIPSIPTSCFASLELARERQRSLANLHGAHAQYVKDEGIERDEALLVRSSGSKSSNKVTIIN